MREIKDYLIYEGEQYRSPEKAGDAKDRMLSLRKKGQVARKTITQIANFFKKCILIGTCIQQVSG